MPKYIGKQAKAILGMQDISPNMRILAQSVPPDAWLNTTGYFPGQDLNSSIWTVPGKSIYLTIGQAREIEPMGCQSDE